MKLKDFLDKKPLFYREIDYERMPNAYNSIKRYFNIPKTVHIVGTNAKGSTGRFLASLLLSKGVSVGHYSSPHIFSFNERIWINGRDIDNDTLEKYHLKLQNLLHVNYLDSLSYFEYTTLLAMLVFQDSCEYVVLEAGLGGERDATNVFPKDLSIITPVGFDHQEFLGESIEEIATTKINSIYKKALISKQNFEEVLKTANKIAKKKKACLYEISDILKRNEKDEIIDIVKKKDLPDFQKENLLLAFAAFRLLGFNGMITDKTHLYTMQGRCQKISENIICDVGHNILAAKVVKRCFSDKKVILIYNSFKDKNYKAILKELCDIIESVEILDIKSERDMAKEEIEEYLPSLGLQYKEFNDIDSQKQYLVFGSFLVVEKFIKDFFER